MILNKLKYLGHLFVIISLYFIFRSLSSLDINTSLLSSYFSPENIVLALISLLLYILALYAGAFLWIFLLRKISNNKNLPIRSLLHIYSKSNLGKYLPGNVMHFVARNILAKKYSLSHKIIAASSFLEVAFILLSGALLLVSVTAISTVNINTEGYSQYFSSRYLFAALFTLIISFVFLYVFRKKFSLNIDNIIQSTPRLPALLSALSGYIIIYLILGISLLFIMIIFDNIELTPHNYWNILYVFVFSWIIGFIVPGAPGGIGIREAIFIILLSQSYSKEAVVLVALSYRAINIIGDIIFYSLAQRLQKNTT